MKRERVVLFFLSWWLLGNYDNTFQSIFELKIKIDATWVASALICKWICFSVFQAIGKICVYDCVRCYNYTIKREMKCKKISLMCLSRWLLGNYDSILYDSNGYGSSQPLWKGNIIISELGNIPKSVLLSSKKLRN